ncbi:Serine incorporator 3 [Perkinsus chesapeaki]|uniref:Serine incorporator 3 n=1 Tax=Perkinsus chesapeaki TaxID=330153 RepID=A0A7J6ME27_PERCH|nr:Serine incorporator 3 [Perkinsus chesapeaki]
MGAIFSMVGSFFTSCLGSLTGTCCAKALGLGTLRQDASRIGYLILNLYTIVLSLAMGALFGGNKSLQWWFGYLPGIGKCTSEEDDQLVEECFYSNLVQRITFTYALMHLAIFLLCTCGDGLARKANNRYFVLKFVMIPVVAFALCFTPNDIFHFLFVTLVPLSFIYVLMQQVMLIDLAYSWNEAWVANAEDYSNSEATSRAWFIAIVFSAVVLLALGCYNFFLGISRAHWCAVVLVVQVACLAGSLTEYIPHGALLPSSVIFSYSAWLSAPGAGLQGAVGWILYAFTTIYAMTKAKGDSSMAGQDARRLSESLTNGNQSEGSSSRRQQEPTDNETSKSLMVLHLCGTLIGLYLAPAITGVLPPWFCPAAAATVTVLYGWTLVAPLVLTDREF